MPGSSPWSIFEVVYAISVLVHFHGLGSITLAQALGYRILAEADDVYLYEESQACKSPKAEQDLSVVKSRVRQREDGKQLGSRLSPLMRYPLRVATPWLAG